MKETLTESQIADYLFRDEYAGWSYSGAKALAEYLIQLDNDLGTDTEFDCVSIRSDFHECSSLEEFASEYGFDPTEEDETDRENEIREFIQDNGTLIEFDGGIIVSNF